MRRFVALQEMAAQAEGGSTRTMKGVSNALMQVRSCTAIACVLFVLVLAAAKSGQPSVSVCRRL